MFQAKVFNNIEMEYFNKQIAVVMNINLTLIILLFMEYSYFYVYVFYIGKNVLNKLKKNKSNMIIL